MTISGRGLLITGEPGTGKSTLALNFLRNGHVLIADDVVQVARFGNKLIGSVPERFSGLIEFTGRGICDVREMFFPEAFAGSAVIDRAIELCRQPSELTYCMIQLLGIGIPQVSCFYEEVGPSPGQAYTSHDEARMARTERIFFAKHDALVAAI